MSTIFITADLHFGHPNILKHSPARPFSDTFDIVAHDEWLLDLWRSTVNKKDMVYILGDLTFLKSEDARHLLEKLPGMKFLIEGNHDGSVRAYRNYFKEVYQIKDMLFRPSAWPFLGENMRVVMCHYPMVTWEHKPRGAVMLHGHCHGKLDEYNSQSMDLRFDVGIDGTLAGYRFLTLEDIYNAAMTKVTGYGCSSFEEYAMNNYRPEVR
ncbi:MAG: metallophosphoesterase [Bacteroidales bacterium]|nr:metallophosphoesterase [Bacteroidales bacterium]MBQ9711206.1 metallophosphoesterase [Bacteroidales bacterium]